MLGREALAVLVNLSRLMAEKIDEPILHVQGWINGQIAIMAARSYSRMIRGAQLPSPLRDQEPDWDPPSGMGLDIKSHARIILRVNQRTIIHQPHDPTLPTLIRAPCVGQPTGVDRRNVLE